MKQKWSHRKDVAWRSWALDVSSDWNVENMRHSKNAAEVTGRDDTESAGVSVGPVKVEAKRN